MDKEQAEAQIVTLVRQIDHARSVLSGQECDDRVAELKQQIEELKKITGQRHITGVAGR